MRFVVVGASAIAVTFLLAQAPSTAQTGAARDGSKRAPAGRGQRAPQ